MAGRGCRHRSAVAVAALAGSGLAACSSGHETPDAARDCGYSVTWQRRVYLDLVYVLHKPQTRADVRDPAAGRRLGRGVVPQCPGDREGSPATVYAVPGAPPELAVMAS